MSDTLVDSDLRAQIVEALDYEEDDGRPLVDLVEALVAEVYAGHARKMAVMQMANDASKALRNQLLAALGLEDDGVTSLPEYVAALVDKVATSRADTLAEVDALILDNDLYLKWSVEYRKVEPDSYAFAPWRQAVARFIRTYLGAPASEDGTDE